MNPPPVAAAPRLLVVDDEPDLRTLYELALLREGYDIETAACVEEAWALLQAARFDAVITDMRLPDGNGLELLRRLEQAGRPEKTLVITAYGSAENAVLALKAGAFDYLTKPVDLRQFRSVVASALGRVPTPPRAAVTAVAAAVPAPPVAALQRLSGGSAVMGQVRELVTKVARGMAPVLVHGESGTGKELVARAVHQVSHRAAQPFVAVNCGASPEPLLEAEFFGYRKGAFTGASEDREGFFQAASGGTLFLDEIGELPLAMQSKLLRAIQERAVRPVGAVGETALDVRIVSATHRALEQMVAEGSFRQDLLFRLDVLQLQVPPLRERTEDILPLAQVFLERACAQIGRPRPRIGAAAAAALLAHPWTGNVRQLQNVVFRAVTLSEAPVIEPADLEFVGSAPAPAVDAVTIAAPAIEEIGSLDDAVAGFEKALLQRLYREHPSTRKLAERLRTSHSAIAVRLRKYGVGGGGGSSRSRG